MKRFISLHHIKSYNDSINMSTPRLLLTISGMVIGIVLFLVLLITIDSFEQTIVGEYHDYDSNNIMIEFENGLSIKEVNDLTRKLGEDYQLSYYSDPVEVVDQIDGVPVLFRIFAASNNFTSNKVYAYFTNTFSFIDTPNIYQPAYLLGDQLGRVTASDNTVITSELAVLMFDSETPFGKTLKIDTNSDSDLRLNVVGVLNSPNNIKSIIRYNNVHTGGNVENYKLLPLNVYITAEKFNDHFNLKSSIKKLVISSKTLDKGFVNEIVKSFDPKAFDSDQISIIDDKYIKQRVKGRVEGYKPIIMLLTMVILFISGITIMNTMFFNINEKVSEIGIRKALGARRLDIVVQFVYEGLVYATIGMVVAIFVSFCILAILFIYVFVEKGIVIDVSIKLRTISLVLVLVWIEGILFSVLPAVYASNQKISDTIRYE